MLLEKPLGIKTREDVLNWIKQHGKKLDEKEINAKTVIGMFTDHREFWVVSFARGKSGYKRLKKQLTEMLKADEKAHTKTKRMRGQLFILVDPEKHEKYLVETHT